MTNEGTPPERPFQSNLKNEGLKTPLKELLRFGDISKRFKQHRVFEET